MLLTKNRGSVLYPKYGGAFLRLVFFLQHIIKTATSFVVSRQIMEEDLAEGEYDDDEAGIYRRRLSTCVLKFSEVKS